MRCRDICLKCRDTSDMTRVESGVQLRADRRQTQAVTRKVTGAKALGLASGPAPGGWGRRRRARPRGSRASSCGAARGSGCGSGHWGDRPGPGGGAVFFFFLLINHSYELSSCSNAALPATTVPHLHLGCNAACCTPIHHLICEGFRQVYILEVCIDLPFSQMVRLFISNLWS